MESGTTCGGIEPNVKEEIAGASAPIEMLPDGYDGIVVEGIGKEIGEGIVEGIGEGDAASVRVIVLLGG